jgi:hypothetical protein
LTLYADLAVFVQVVKSLPQLVRMRALSVQPGATPSILHAYPAKKERSAGLPAHHLVPFAILDVFRILPTPLNGNVSLGDTQF